MKIILIILTIIQLIGIISSISLSGSLVLGIQDMWGGILLIAILWVIWGVVRYSKSKKSEPQI